MRAEVVGKSSGWVGPMQEYEKNEGSAGRKRIAFIGASYKFVHKVLRDMLLVGDSMSASWWCTISTKRR